VQLQRIRGAAAALALLVPLLPGGVATVRAAEPVEVTFSYTGAEQVFVVPDDVTTIHVALVGGRGGTGGSFGSIGGFGAHVEGDLAVAPGTTFYVEVGGTGGNGLLSNAGVGGFNGGASGGPGSGKGGGGGGGATDLRTASQGTSGSLESRLIVAAGGGGGSGGSPSAIGGDSGAGGDGPGGSAGQSTIGGTGGVLGTSAGQEGSLGLGGAGGPSDGDITGGGGGGGSGLYGGGGGAGGQLGQSGGGGGGGSSYTGTATNASVTVDATGTSSIAITFVSDTGGGGSDSGTVAAEVTVPTSAACLELSTTAIDFGTLPLGVVGQPASPDVVVTNCSGVSETILARGTDASATGAAWTLTDAAATCADTLGSDTYRLGLEASGGALVQLSTTNKTLQPLESGASGTHTARIDTACPGSSGAGTTMTMQIVFVATDLTP